MNTIRILITGSNGQLGNDIIKSLSKFHDVFGFVKDKLDITNIDNIRNIVTTIHPDIIINCAAYTNVDNCEENIQLAYDINSYGCYNLALIGNQYNTCIIHISTDYIFDGLKNKPYIEDDEANPINIYGKTKLLGETIIKTICHRYFIIRTSWMYGKNGKNFVNTILELAQKKDVITVVDDQIGTPTYTIDLINVINKLILTNAYGTYHISNNGQCSWYEFAKSITAIKKLKTNIIPIKTKQLNQKANRPRYSVLQNNMLECNFNYFVRNWDNALHEFLSKL